MDTRHERIRTFSEMATEFYVGYTLRLPDSAAFAEYAINHLRLLRGSRMLVDFNDAVADQYQNDPSIRPRSLSMSDSSDAYSVIYGLPVQRL